MKKIILIAVSGLFIMACSQQSKTPQTFYGEKITADGTIDAGEIVSKMGDAKEMNMKITGTVEEVCQKKGCWMKIKGASGEAIRITFKDYGFFMPKDCAGKIAIAEGIAKIEETSVADLQEYAKDGGKSEAEIAAITTPERELVFEASGVILN